MTIIKKNRAVKLLPSRLKHRVSIQSIMKTPDGMGGFTESWQDIATVWAAIDSVRGSEGFEASKRSTDKTYKITIRYLSGIDESQRIKYGSRIFEIEHVNNIEESNICCEISAKEKTT